MNGVGFFFQPEGREYHPNIEYQGLFLEPHWDKLEARDTRSYVFYWRPGKSEIGEGTLFLTLPDDFEVVAPFKVKIIKSSEKDAALKGDE